MVLDLEVEPAVEEVVTVGAEAVHLVRVRARGRVRVRARGRVRVRARVRGSRAPGEGEG